MVLVSLSPLFEYLFVRALRLRGHVDLYIRCVDAAARRHERLIVKPILNRLSVFSLAFFLGGLPALAQDQALIDSGAALYEMHCSGCHGVGLRNPGTSFDLRALTEGERARFDAGVMDGKNMMPPWRGTVTDENLNELWAYIRAYAYE